MSRNFNWFNKSKLISRYFINAFFKNNKKFNITTGFKKKLRCITINENKINEKILDFSNNTEPLIQRFITDYLKHLKKTKVFFGL